jgi:hypothetical protein
MKKRLFSIVFVTILLTNFSNSFGNIPVRSIEKHINYGKKITITICLTEILFGVCLGDEITITIEVEVKYEGEIKPSYEGRISSNGKNLLIPDLPTMIKSVELASDYSYSVTKQGKKISLFIKKGTYQINNTSSKNTIPVTTTKE